MEHTHGARKPCVGPSKGRVIYKGIAHLQREGINNPHGGAHASKSKAAMIHGCCLLQGVETGQSSGRACLASFVWYRLLTGVGYENAPWLEKGFRLYRRGAWVATER